MLSVVPCYSFIDAPDRGRTLFKGRLGMSLKSVCPMVTTNRLQETRAFYDWLGFRVVCADPRSLQFAWPDDPDLRIGFIVAEDPNQPGVFQARFGGEGVVLRFDVEDIETLYRRIGAVHTLAVKLRDGPCGRRHFAIIDPNGLVLEFVGPLRSTADRKDRLDGIAHPVPKAAARAVLYPRTAQATFAG